MPRKLHSADTCMFFACVDAEFFVTETPKGKVQDARKLDLIRRVRIRRTGEGERVRTKQVRQGNRQQRGDGLGFKGVAECSRAECCALAESKAAPGCTWVGHSVGHGGSSPAVTVVQDVAIPTTNPPSPAMHHFQQLHYAEAHYVHH